MLVRLEATAPMQAYTYIVRIYASEAASRLAGTVEIVHSGRTVAFRSLKDLHAILRTASSPPKQSK